MSPVGMWAGWLLFGLGALDGLMLGVTLLAACALGVLPAWLVSGRMSAARVEAQCWDEFARWSRREAWRSQTLARVLSTPTQAMVPIWELDGSRVGGPRRAGPGGSRHLVGAAR